VALVGAKSYDCLTQHAITSFADQDGPPTWSGPLEGHDAFMQAALSRNAQVARLREALPRRTPLWLTEASTIVGDSQAFPSWATSASHAAYMASLWATWMNLRIPWGMSDDLLWGSDRAVLGPAPDYTFTADAVTRQALAPMFSAGGRVLATRTIANPLRSPPTGGRSYSGLAVAATRHKGTLFLMVVNRLPLRSVTARISLNGFTSNRSAEVRRVQGDNFTSWNKPGEQPSVRMSTEVRQIGTSSFLHTFQPTSTTVFRIQHR
jgi:hypothetical protein